jgi:ATP-dependent protease HslVU (ClpYQ) peptidase subunit
MEHLVTVFVPSVREALKTHAVSMTENGQEHADDSIMLVGWRHRLFIIDSKFAVDEYERGFDAIGSGGDIALGAMAVLSPKLNPETRIKRALQAAADCGLYVRPPFVIRSTGEIT